MKLYVKKEVVEDRVVVNLMGDLNYETAPTLERHLVGLFGQLEGDEKCVIIDLNDLDIITLEGLSLLLNFEKVANKSGEYILVVVNKPSIFRRFQTTALDQYMLLFKTVEDALAFR